MLPLGYSNCAFGYVAPGEGNLRSIMNGLAGWYLWDTESMLEEFGWIRTMNELREPGDDSFDVERHAITESSNLRSERGGIFALDPLARSTSSTSNAVSDPSRSRMCPSM